MAIFRQIHTHIWDDSRFEDFSAYAKLLFIYGFSNKHRNEAGIYPISIKKMAFETAIPSEEIESALKEIVDSGAWEYDYEARILWIVNALKYQSMSPNGLAAVKKDIETISSPLISTFKAYYEGILSPFEAPSKPLDNPCETPSAKGNTKGNTNTNTKVNTKGNRDMPPAPKIMFGELVTMTQSQYDKLVNDYGIDEITYQISALDNYIANTEKGKKYARHDLAIRKWIEKDRKSKSTSPSASANKNVIPDFMMGEYGPLRQVGIVMKGESR